MVLDINNTGVLECDTIPGTPPTMLQGTTKKETGKNKQFKEHTGPAVRGSASLARVVKSSSRDRCRRSYVQPSPFRRSIKVV